MAIMALCTATSELAQTTLRSVLGKHELDEMLSERDKLNEDLQEILVTASEVMNKRIHDELTARNNEALQTLVNDHNVELRRLPDDVLREFRRLSEEVILEMASVDDTSQRVYQSFKSFLDGVSAYHRIAEDAFIEARNLPVD